MTYLTKAREYNHRAGKRVPRHLLEETDQERADLLEVSLAYLNSEITSTQAAYALGSHANVALYKFARILRWGVANKRVKFSLR